MTAEAQIRVEGLRKSFFVAERDPGLWGAVKGLFRRRHREVKALDDVSFTVERGELVGYIGPNGAGKSTTVKTLSGILVPDGGLCRVSGRVPWEDRRVHVAAIGVVFGQRTQLWWDLPVAESFDLLRDVYSLEKGRYGRTRDELVSLLELGSLMAVPVRQLSLGQRMRCEFAASLLHEPEILFLDEPTIGLDAVSKLAVRDFVRRRNREHGTTVLLTSHDMHDVEALCDRVMVIGRGRLLADSTFAALRERVTDELRLVADLEELPGELDLEGARVVRRQGHRVEWAYDPARTPSARLIRELTARFPIADLELRRPPIEEIVARLYDDLDRGDDEPEAHADPSEAAHGMSDEGSVRRDEGELPPEGAQADPAGAGADPAGAGAGPADAEEERS